MLKNLQLHCDVWFEIEFKLQSYQNLIKFLDLNLNENLIEKTKIKRKTSFHSDFKPSFSLNLKFSLAHQAPAIFVKFFFYYLFTYCIYAFTAFIYLFVCFLWYTSSIYALGVFKISKTFLPLDNLWFQQKTYYKKPHNYTWNNSVEKLTEGISALQRQCYYTLYYHGAINEL